MGTTESTLYANENTEPPLDPNPRRTARRPPPTPTTVLKCVVIGPPKSGKTSLLQRLQGHELDDTSTRDSNDNGSTNRQGSMVVPYKPPTASSFPPEGREKILLRVYVQEQVVAAVEENSSIESGRAAVVDVWIVVVDMRMPKLTQYLTELIGSIIQHDRQRPGVSGSPPSNICVLLNFRDQLEDESVASLQYHKIHQAATNYLSRQQQQHKQHHQLKVFLSSMKNCYGLSSLHQFLFVAYLLRKRLELQTTLQLVDRELTKQPKTEENMPYEEFLGLLEEGAEDGKNDEVVEDDGSNDMNRIVPNQLTSDVYGEFHHAHHPHADNFVSHPHPPEPPAQRQEARRTMFPKRTGSPPPRMTKMNMPGSERPSSPPRPAATRLGVDSKTTTLDDFFAESDDDDGGNYGNFGANKNQNNMENEWEEDEDDDDFFYDEEGTQKVSKPTNKIGPSRGKTKLASNNMTATEQQTAPRAPLGKQIIESKAEQKSEKDSKKISQYNVKDTSTDSSSLPKPTTQRLMATEGDSIMGGDSDGWGEDDFAWGEDDDLDDVLQEPEAETVSKKVPMNTDDDDEGGDSIVGKTSRTIAEPKTGTLPKEALTEADDDGDGDFMVGENTKSTATHKAESVPQKVPIEADGDDDDDDFMVGGTTQTAKARSSKPRVRAKDARKRTSQTTPASIAAPSNPKTTLSNAARAAIAAAQQEAEMMAQQGSGVTGTGTTSVNGEEKKKKKKKKKDGEKKKPKKKKEPVVVPGEQS